MLLKKGVWEGPEGEGEGPGEGGEEGQGAEEVRGRREEKGERVKFTNQITKKMKNMHVN